MDKSVQCSVVIKDKRNVSQEIFADCTLQLKIASLIITYINYWMLDADIGKS